MGIREWFRGERPRPAVTAAGRPGRVFSATPYNPVDWALQWLTSDAAGAPVPRWQALEVPAIQRARNQICSIATLPMFTYKGLVVDTSVHPLLRQIDPDVGNVVTLAYTYEDLLFEGVAWWRVLATDFNGYPIAARWVSVCDVSVPSATRPAPAGFGPGVWICGEWVPAAQVIRFDSPNPGVLTVNARAIRIARLLDETAGTYAKDPRPLDWFTDNPDYNGDHEPTDDEIGDFLDQWSSARKRHATGKVPSWLSYNAGAPVSAADMNLVELKKQAMLEIANGTGVDPEDLGLSTTSRTYFNAQDRRISKVNETFQPFISAVTGRLSMGDVTRRGYDVRVDLTDFLKADTLTQAQVASTLISSGVMSADEARPWFGLSGAAPIAPDAPAPDAPATTDPSTDVAAPAAAPGDGAAAAAAPRLTLSVTAFAASDRSSVAFSVDAESRTIRGVAVPYGVTGSKYGEKYSFEPGSLEWSQTSRVKHLIDHNQPIGHAVDLQNQDHGLDAALNVMPGDDGDRLLTAAKHGVYDGLSVGVDFGPDDYTVDKDGTLRIHRADLREVSTTAMPVFDDARVTSVAASLTASKKEHPVPDADKDKKTAGAPATDPTTAGAPPAAPAAPADDDRTDADGKWTDRDSPGPGTSGTFSRAQLDALAAAGIVLPGGRPATVDPTRRGVTSTREQLPYTFARVPQNGPGGRSYEWRVADGDHSFGADLRSMMHSGDSEGHTEFGRRVLAAIGYAARATFAGVITTDVSPLNPSLQRPDLYVDVPDFRYPIMNLISRGAPPNGVQPFIFPKFSAASSLVAAHVEGTEPSQGSFSVTNQTVTPAAVSGEVNVTRETIDMGGNPATQTLIFNKMVQAYNEAMETAAATFLNTLTAATDIPLNTGATAGAAPTSAQLFANWTAALSGLPFNRGYDFSAMVIEQNLYQAFAAAVDTTGRPLFPMIGPTNSNGSAAPRFQTIDLGGVTGLPSWALTHTAGSPNNSWLFDPATVFAWVTEPQRLDFPGRKPSDGSYAPVAWVGMGIWGYDAFANTDINGVRQVTYDTTT